MLPNWLYGKSKSKLASILGGGGGAPADYNQVKAQVNQNTEDITLLSDALDDKAALTQISNPNLLDNPWFTVNQRGSNSYTSDGYTVDRWAIYHGSLAVSNGIVFTKTDDGASVYQYIENDTVYNKICTLSAIIDGVLYKASGTIPSGKTESWQNIITEQVTGTITIKAFVSPSSSNGDIRVEITFSDSTAHAIRAVKLELGSVSTLAMDTAPNYATELLKCQRYFIGGKLESLYAYKASGRINAFMLLPVTMRSAPVIVGTAGVYSLDDNSAVSGASIESPLELYSNGVKFPISGANDTLCRVFIASGSGLSADL